MHNNDQVTWYTFSATPDAPNYAMYFVEISHGPLVSMA